MNQYQSELDDRHPSQRKPGEEKIVNLTLKRVGDLAVFSEENALDAPKELVNAVLTKYLSGMSLRDLALDCGIQVGALAVWAKEYKWEEQRNMVIRDLLYAAELQYRDFAYKRRVEAASRNYDVSVGMTDKLQSAADTLGLLQKAMQEELLKDDPDERLLGSLENKIKLMSKLVATYSKLAEAQLSMTEVGNKAIDSIRGVAEETNEMNSKSLLGLAHSNPLIVINNDSRSATPYGRDPEHQERLIPVTDVSFAPGEGGKRLNS